MVIDEDELLESVRAVHDAAESAHAVNVRIELVDIEDAGGYFDVMDVADDLAELESRAGNSNSFPLRTGVGVSRRVRSSRTARANAVLRTAGR
jgi:hypothetical protein